MPPSITTVAKLKVQLKLSIARLRMVQQRDEAMGKAQRRAMAQLLEVGKIDSARIRTENIIRSDINTELHEILELYCELLLARAALLESPTCDPGLEEAVKSIIYAAPRTEIKELQQVRVLLGERFGKEFVLAAMDNSDGAVSEKGYLEEIAKAYGVDWPKGTRELGQPPELVDEELNNGGHDRGSGGGQAHDISGADLPATPPRTLGSSNPLHVNPSSPSTENPRPKVTLNSMELKLSKQPADSGTAKPREDGKGTGIPEVNELAARFAALKR
ncbi:hypothetical protein EKO27_g6033 [Xylaria grammica]|uniref:Uncharacterized protein n=1 Tax=Xylaria grammica TaxID=363999 RepID=A0A439D3U2_9PEZI|nr:hypothetical protein EKO27_g6033 [Xylaria grammica]